VVWSERPPSPTPRDPHESTVDHVAGRTITVAGLDATFNRSTGRSKPVPRGPGAFAFKTYVAVDLDSERAHEVLGAATVGIVKRRRPEPCRRGWETGAPRTGNPPFETLRALDGT
jgi:hypothetical protein